MKAYALLLTMTAAAGALGVGCAEEPEAPPIERTGTNLSGQSAEVPDALCAARCAEFREVTYPECPVASVVLLAEIDACECTLHCTETRFVVTELPR